MISKTAWMVRSALIAALYAALTFVIPFSSGLMQVRLSEAMCVLPYFMSSAVPGLFIGCLIGNLVSGAIPVDVIFGSLASLLAAYMVYLMGKRGVNKWLAPLPAVVINALVLGGVFCYAYGWADYWVCALYVGAGQGIACYGIGMPLMYAVKRYGGKVLNGRG